LTTAVGLVILNVEPKRGKSLAGGEYALTLCYRAWWVSLSDPMGNALGTLH